MFYIFEMANNHQGSIEHAKRIIDNFSALASRTGITAGIKLQFRQLKTFIHKDYQNSDLKYVKRFNETKLTQEQFQELCDSGYTESYAPRSYTSEITEKLSLPYEYIPLCERQSSPDYRHAMSYLMKRGISILDIIKYGID